MKIEKAQMTVGEDTLRITMPLQKVDKERRIVSGFATTDGIDKHGDVVTKEASAAAFSEFLGNVRLMHQPIPAGKVLKFREEQYFDPKTNQAHNGIFVETYVSKGAENVWEMVLDGTLTGFSIGGDEVVAETEFSKDAGRNIRKITSYRMHELSLVDNPANAHSNILSIQKSADGVVTAEGTLADIEVNNVFYCNKDHEDNEPVALFGPESDKTCISCEAPMRNIGWFETDGGDKAEKVSAIITKFEATEGGENMPKDETKTAKELAEDEATQVESAEEVSPKGDSETIAPEGEEAKTATDVKEENVSVTGTGEVKVEEAKELNEATKIEEGAVEENPLTKMFDELRASITETVSKNTEAVQGITAKVEAELNKLAAQHNELKEQVGALTGKLESVEKSIDTVEKSGAFKKSADLGGSEENSSLQKSNSKWAGTFFSMDGIR